MINELDETRKTLPIEKGTSTSPGSTSASRSTQLVGFPADGEPVLYDSREDTKLREAPSRRGVSTG
jgi:hypothetical protein